MVSGSLHWKLNQKIKLSIFLLKKKKNGIKFTCRTHRICSDTISGLRGSRNILGNDKIPPEDKPTEKEKLIAVFKVN